MLVDRDDYWLNSEYRQWITDPDDPEVQKARKERQRRGVKPPPFPTLVPVALRPEGLAEIRRAQYEKALVEQAPAPEPKLVSVRDLAQMFSA
ncbi:hypothetical protein ACWDTG_06705 [Rhodococcus zopfii]